jgi:hypothetical protein
MVTQAVAHPSFQDGNALVVERDRQFVEPAEGTVDQLDPARGVLLAVVLCVPFWIALFWALL